MVTEARKPWKGMNDTERRERVAEILAELERRGESEAQPKTIGEWRESVRYLKAATIFASSMLGTRPS